MGVDVFLKVGDIQGESTDAKHAGEIEVVSWAWVGFFEVGVRVDAARNKPQTGGVDALRGRPFARVECQRGNPLVRNDDIRREGAAFADDRPVLDDDIGACHAVPACFRPLCRAPGTKGSKTCSIVSAVIPSPQSETRMTA